MISEDPQSMDNDNEKESGIESESDSGNETISSENVEIPGSNLSELAPCERSTDLVSQLANRRSYRHINFATSDIDAFIASVTVPPPPSEDEKARMLAERDIEAKQEVSLPPPVEEKKSFPSPPPQTQKTESAKVSASPPNDDALQKLLRKNHDIMLDDEFLKYVIPAPPSSSDSVMSISDIPIVRPPTRSLSPSPMDDIVSNGARDKVMSVRDNVIDTKDKFDNKVKDTVRQLEQSNQGLRRNSSSSSGGSIKRPTEAPPPPPGSAGKTGDLKVPRPAPPRRYSSLEPPGSATSSAPTTPLGPEPKTSIEINVSKRPLQGVKSVSSISADNSPLHQPLHHASSTGTLKKLGGKYPAPQPPPRRSSMPTGGGTSPMSIESVAERIRLLQHGPKVPDTDEVFEKPSSPIPVAKVQGKPAKVEAPGSPIPGSPRTKGVSANIQARQEALRQAATFKKEKSEAPSSSTEAPTETPSTSTVSASTATSTATTTTAQAPSSPAASSEMVAIVPGMPNSRTDQYKNAYVLFNNEL